MYPLRFRLMKKDINYIIKEIQEISLYDIIVPIWWGILNTLAGLISIPVFQKTYDIKYIWLFTVIIGIIGNIIIRKLALSKKGFTLLESKIVNYIWSGIIIGIIISTFITYSFINFKTDWDLTLYIFSNVSLFIGTGLIITGLTVRRKEKRFGNFIIVSGILWLFFSVFGCQAREKTIFFTSYAITSFISLVIFPIIGYYGRGEK